jgi:hypothetical protein
MKEPFFEICSLVRLWLQECSSVHTKSVHERVVEPCPPDVDEQLPTRILRVSGSCESPSIRLLETNSLRGRYYALSHCWGPADKRPMMTTKENLQNHLSDIPFDQLPKTFQDAVMLTLSLGVEFLWIDSLCVIQHDAEDWKSEAKKMGMVYRNASLVIAAGGAEDSTKGLGITERQQQQIIKAPYVVDGISKGTFNIALMRESYMNWPTEGPLRKRAWAFQEWHLARRLVVFMPSSVTWSCVGTTLGERGSGAHFWFEEKTSWLDLLTTYSSRALTYPSDRLYALHGIVTHLQDTQPHRFTKYHFDHGVWENELIDQLLWWRHVKETEDNSAATTLNIPSWSWAATGYSKAWYPAFGKDKARRVLKEPEVTSSGSLRVVGPIITLTQVSPSWDRRLDSREFEDMIFFRTTCTTHPKYGIPDEYFPGTHLGYTLFDDEPVVPVKCVFMTTTRPKIWGDPIADKHHKTAAESDVSNTSEEVARSMEVTKFLYWALLLEPVGEAKYKRVGIAVLYPHAFDHPSKELSEFEII